MRIRGVVMIVVAAAILSSCKGRLFPAGGGDVAAEVKASDTSQAAATAGLITMRSLVKQENYAGLGFSSVEEAQRAQLGDPLHIYRVGLDALMGFKEGVNADAIVMDGRKWIYPVMVDQRVASSLSVTQRDNGWRATDFGGAALARALISHRESKEDVVVWVPAMKIYFTARGNGESMILTPIMDDPRFQFKAGEAMPASRVLAVLQQSAKEYNGLPQ